MKSTRIISFVAGKSGGHIIPCLTIAQREKNKHAQTRILFFSTTASLDNNILHNNTLIDDYVTLPLIQVKPQHWYLFPIIIWHFLRSFFMSIYHLIKQKPERIISTGGSVTIPVFLAAKLLRIPIELYELNVKPGSTIKWLAPFATKIHTCFKKTEQYLAKYQCAHTAYPIRFSATDKQIKKEDARKKLNLDQTRTTLFILGGSQGSHFINMCIKELVHNYPQLKDTLQVIHQTGAHDAQNWELFYTERAIPAQVFSYHHDIALYYVAADLIISRAGAGALFEILFFNKPCIVIPLETKKNNHQLYNAQEMIIRYQRLFTMIRQQNIKKNPQPLFDVINRYLTLK